MYRLGPEFPPIVVDRFTFSATYTFEGVPPTATPASLSTQYVVLVYDTGHPGATLPKLSYLKINLGCFPATYTYPASWAMPTASRTVSGASWMTWLTAPDEWSNRRQIRSAFA